MIDQTYADTGIGHEVHAKVVGNVTRQISEIHEQLGQLNIHIDELRSRLGFALAPDSSLADSRGEKVPDMVQPSELGIELMRIKDTIQSLGGSIVAIHDRVDL